MQKHLHKILLAILLLSLLFVFVDFLNTNKQSSFSFCEDYPTDRLEYLFPAANLAMHNQFPYFGFIGEKSEYLLCDDEIAEQENVYKQTLSDTPAIVFPSKPPFYSFVLGISFKIFGYAPNTAKLLNYIITIFMFFLMFKTSLLLIEGGKGVVLGIASTISLCFFSNIDRNLIATDAELLTQLLVIYCFYVFLLAFKKRKASYFFLFGIATSFLVLTKPYFLISALFLFLYFVFFKQKDIYLKNIILYVAGLVIFIIPWSIFINKSVKEDISNRISFHNKLKSTAPLKTYLQHDDLFEEDGDFKKEAVIDLMFFHQYQHAIENEFFLITNQDGDYNILNVHNEFCTDGEFHPEWRIVESSFYNQIDATLKHQKLFAFYTKNFWLGININIAKIRNAMTFKNISFWLTFVLLTSMFILNFKAFIKHQALIFSVFFIVNIIAVVLILYGDIRFVETVIPLINLIFISLIITLSSNFRLSNF